MGRVKEYLVGTVPQLEIVDAPAQDALAGNTDFQEGVTFLQAADILLHNVKGIVNICCYNIRRSGGRYVQLLPDPEIAGICTGIYRQQRGQGNMIPSADSVKGIP